MRTDHGAVQSMDEYIARFPPEIQEILAKIRAVIREAAPDATEAIRYEIPTFVLHGNLVHFAAFQNHIGFYPTPAGIEAFQEELAPYTAGKGTIRFPLDRPIPYDLIRRVVEQRVKESLASAEAKKRKK